MRLYGSVAVRDAEVADVPAIMEVRRAGWRAGYRGIVPPAYLDALDTGPEALARGVREFHGRPAARRQVVAERDGRVVAFAVHGDERPAPPARPGGSPRGELHALCVHPDAWSCGIGSLLVEHTRWILARQGRHELVLWVLEANARARALYERHGLRPTGSRTMLRIGGARLPELQYGSALDGAPRPAREAGGGCDHPAAVSGGQPGDAGGRRPLPAGASRGAGPGPRPDGPRW